MLDIILFASGICLGALGAVFFKAGSSDIVWEGNWVETSLSLLTNWKVWTGLILYVLPTIFWIYLLKRYPVSFVQPILSLTYVVTPILAIIFLSEAVTVWRWLGIIVIIIGVSIISRT